MIRQGWNIGVRVALWGCVGLALGLPAHSKSPEEISAQLAANVVLIHTLNEQGEVEGTGSGVMIAPGALITNCHVVEEAHAIEVLQGSLRQPGSLRYADEERDLCEIAVPALEVPTLSIVPQSELQVGQRLYTIGHPLGLDRTFSSGLLAAIHEGARPLQISAPISPGSSQ